MCMQLTFRKSINQSKYFDIHHEIIMKYQNVFFLYSFIHSFDKKKYLDEK